MSRLPIRARLTAAFALAMVVVMAGTGLFVYLRHQSDLDDAINDSLARRAAAVALPPGRPASALRAEAGSPQDSEESFSQVIAADGRIIDSAGGRRGLGRSVLSATQRDRAARETVVIDSQIPGIDSTTRVLARRAGTPEGPVVVAVGQSLEDRNETLADLVRSFTVGGPIAVLIASLLGYALATASLAPIEAIRRRAGEISLAEERELLPLPRARDEVRRLGETLNEMLVRLRAAFEHERRFVGDASHELRTPVAVIKAELEAALRSGELGPRARQGVVAAVEECDNLAALAEGLLVLARGAEGGLPVRPEAIDAQELLERVRDTFADRARERDRQIRIDATDGLKLNADPLLLRQALGNLVDNGLRHGAGTVVLGARAVAGGIVIEVSDSGPGFDPEIAARAFERFTRGDGARTMDGSGLGLAIVRTVAEAHGGGAEIDRDSRTIRLRLPPSTPARHRAHADSNQAGPGRRADQVSS